MKNNSICAICGKPYYTCNSCGEYKRLYPWKMFTDTSEHYKIYQIIHGYSIGVYDKAETKSKLQNVDLSDLDTFIESIQTIITDILGTVSIPNQQSITNTSTVDKKQSIKKTRKKHIKINNV